MASGYKPIFCIHLTLMNIKHAITEYMGYNVMQHKLIEIYTIVHRFINWSDYMYIAWITGMYIYGG